ncbi:RsmB/NOP family class I SAM-dependent RNA methyltransferase [Paenibacillus cymbidii]|uniref:RsmB/NOP family class I SAM-dependent RNA methyltransferase n=1 Tax=Paenibacillus cymbidii TaxID=1639034 RepID=UPI001080F3B3|nr:RsmB/NOP family class I SAM-dependent RNA methyltransferase [Paenibacillus cymbidii]
MATHLPLVFVDRMKALLGAEYEAFEASYDAPRLYGLRVNKLKIGAAAFERLSPFALSSVPWAEEGFYYAEGERPGKHPYYHAGIYYIQEPSAMLPVELLDVSPGDRVLDLCAAPGGKSTQIAAKLAGEGVLVVNDNSRERVKALVKNIEIAGVRGAVVLNEEPEKLVRAFAGYFDKILIDAPCSGEGMFRKDEDMARQWERHSIERCSAMQRDILRHAAAMVAPGGTLVYSTCTFAPEENEGTIAQFLREHDDFALQPVPLRHGFAPGRPEWLARGDGEAADAAASAVAGAVRLWPHRVNGEGHFAAVLRRSREAARPPAAAIALPAARGSARQGKPSARGGDGLPDLAPWLRFAAEQLTAPPAGKPVAFAEHLYLAPEGLPALDGIRVVRPGLYVGSLHRSRFEPAHALALALRAEEAKRRLELRADEPAALRYLKGETLQVEAERLTTSGDTLAKGYCLVCIDGFPVGWGKWLDGMLKNDYPPGWRWT